MGAWFTSLSYIFLMAIEEHPSFTIPAGRTNPIKRLAKIAFQFLIFRDKSGTIKVSEMHRFREG